MQTFHWEGSLAAQGARVSWGHPVAQEGWGRFSLEGQTLGEACLSQGLAPAGTLICEAPRHANKAAVTFFLGLNSC